MRIYKEILKTLLSVKRILFFAFFCELSCSLAIPERIKHTRASIVEEFFGVKADAESVAEIPTPLEAARPVTHDARSDQLDAMLRYIYLLQGYREEHDAVEKLKARLRDFLDSESLLSADAVEIIEDLHPFDYDVAARVAMRLSMLPIETDNEESSMRWQDMLTRIHLVCESLASYTYLSRVMESRIFAEAAVRKSLMKLAHKWKDKGEMRRRSLAEVEPHEQSHSSDISSALQSMVETMEAYENLVALMTEAGEFSGDVEEKLRGIMLLRTGVGLEVFAENSGSLKASSRRQLDLLIQALKNEMKVKLEQIDSSSKIDYLIRSARSEYSRLQSLDGRCISAQ